MLTPYNVATMTLSPPKVHIVKKDMDECEMALTFEEIKGNAKKYV